MAAKKTVALNTKQLKDFFSLAGHIKQNLIVPIYSYIHFSKNCVTKSSGNSFINYTIPCEHEFLIDENVLTSAVKNTTSEEIVITIEEKSINITAKDIKKVSSSKENPANFHAHEIPDHVSVTRLTTDVLNAIGICGSIIADDPNTPFFSHVFIGNGLVAGTDRAIAYIKEVGEIENIVLTKTVSSTVSSLPECDFFSSGKFHYFKTDKFIYGFIKPEVPAPDYRQFLTAVNNKANFSTDKSEIITSNNLCITTCANRFIIASIAVEKGKCSIVAKDENYEIDAEREFDCSGSLEKFGYNPVLMNKLLKLIPADEIYFQIAPDKMYITDKEKTFYSLIMQYKL